MALISFLLHYPLVQTVFAQLPTPSFVEPGIDGCDGLLTTGEINAGTCIPSFLAHAVETVFAFSGGIFLIIVLYSGYEIILGGLTGGGNESGRNRLQWAIIGFIMCTTAFFIIDFIISSIGG